MFKKIYQLEKQLSKLFKIQRRLDELGLDYDEDAVGNIKHSFVTKYQGQLTEAHLDYIYNI